MTERTLLRRLREENTTFQEVLDSLREELAYDYLRRRDLTIENIAYLLGFSSSSTFSRAFMRWTGQRPSGWRALNMGHERLPAWRCSSLLRYRQIGRATRRERGCPYV